MKNKELVVGLFTTGALVLLYFGFNFLKGKDFLSSTTKYYAVYGNVDQLAVSTPVLVNGVSVGRVNKISILQKLQNKVLVELEIDDDILLGDSTRAILDSDFLGTKSILLSIGRITTPLKAKDTVIAEVAKGVLDVFTETAEPVADNLQTTIRKLNTVLDNLSSNSQSLDTLFSKLQGTPPRLNRMLDNTNMKIEELAGSLKATTDNLNSVLTELKPTVKNFQAFSDSLKRLQLNQTVAEARIMVEKLNIAAGKLSAGDNTMGKLLTEDSLYVNLNKLLLGLDTLSQHFDSNPKHFLAPLGKSQKRIERDRKKEAARNP